jgi:hypothetical protein
MANDKLFEISFDFRLFHLYALGIGLDLLLVRSEMNEFWPNVEFFL